MPDDRGPKQINDRVKIQAAAAAGAMVGTKKAAPPMGGAAKGPRDMSGARTPTCERPSCPQAQPSEATGAGPTLEHFQEKWIPVFRRKCDQTKNLEHDQFPPKLNML